MHPVLEALSESLRAPAPWWLPHLPVARRILDAAHAGPVAAVLNEVRGAELAIPRFVAQAALPGGEPYETFIARTDTVPTRDNLHDLFNGMLWLSFPRTKRRLNELQADAIAANGISGSRGHVRDALTLFDENALVLQAPASLMQPLVARDWKALFVTQREQWSMVQLLTFGHALLEKLMQPRKAITAHVWLTESLRDEDIAAGLSVARLSARPFLPLPVLGVPGWWHANEDPAFYEDAAVFRHRA